MSAEFEKIVLEKFDDLNSKITGLSEEVHELKEKINNIDEKVDNNTSLISNLSKDVRDTQDILKIQGQN